MRSNAVSDWLGTNLESALLLTMKQWMLGMPPLRPSPGQSSWYPTSNSSHSKSFHDDVIKWKYFPRYWSYVRGIHGSPVNSLTKASDAEL